jgi:protein O-mannosyl-transferase
VASADLKPAQQSRAPAAGRVTSSHRVQKLLLGFVLALAVIAVYYPVHSQPFANYDDPDYVSDNFHVRAGLTWTTIKWAMTARDAANWHPVTWLSHALDSQLFGITPAGPHDVNVLLHIVNALLLFWVLQRATGLVGRSWMVSALFALHPINVESVAWIAERKNLLSMLFFLLALRAYDWYARTSPPAPGARDQRGGRFLLVAVLFALGLMSKPQVITFPFVLLLWDYWPLRRLSFEKRAAAEELSSQNVARASASSLIWEKVPLLGLCLISAVLTVNAQSAGGATSNYGHWLRIENAIMSYAGYLGKAIWPLHLTLFYPYPLRPYKLIDVIAAALLLLAISVAVLLARHCRYLVVGWLWFLGTLVPMIGLVQVGTQAMADRYAYLSFVGLFIMVCWSIADWAQQAHAPAMPLRAASVAVLAILAILSHRQVGYWNDHVTLWSHALEVTRDNSVAENNLGTALLKLTRVEEAIPHFRAAVAINPTDPNSNLNIGTYEQMHHNLSAAIERYKAATTFARNPKTKAKAYNNLGYAYKDSGDFIDARESLQKAVEADPEYAGAWISLGIMAQRTADPGLAVSAYSRAMQVHPCDYGYLLLAGALDQSGDGVAAESARRNAELLSRNLGAAQRYANELLSH